MSIKCVNNLSCVQVIDLKTNQKDWYCFRKNKYFTFLGQESPVGKALLGKKIGEIVEVVVPKGILLLKITNICKT